MRLPLTHAEAQDLAGQTWAEAYRQNLDLEMQKAWSYQTHSLLESDSFTSTTGVASSAELTAGEEEDLKSITSWAELQLVRSTRRASVVNAILTSATLEKSIKEYSMRLSGFSIQSVINLLRRTWNFLGSWVRKLTATWSEIG